MIKVLTIIGARPQIIKAAAISRAIKNKFSKNMLDIIVHTGQHYDESMSKVFFDELGIPLPKYNLGVGSKSHGLQTAEMIVGIESIIAKEKPTCIILYGDTNSTLAGAIAASKLYLPIVHVEAGMRSFNKAMPEEINRIMCDHVSSMLFSPTKAGIKNLVAEGFSLKQTSPPSIDHPKLFHCGDVMLDNSLYFSGIAEKRSRIIQKLNLKKNQYLLATLHRDSNTDNPKNLNALFEAFLSITKDSGLPIVLPLHPRTAKLLPKNLNKSLSAAVKKNKLIRILEPVSFLEMIALEMNAKLIMTDSGGVQKEAFFFRKPCIILRSETEWTELVENGNAIVTGADTEKIRKAFSHFMKSTKLSFPPFYGNGKAAEFICKEIISSFSDGK